MKKQQKLTPIKLAKLKVIALALFLTISNPLKANNLEENDFFKEESGSLTAIDYQAPSVKGLLGNLSAKDLEIAVNSPDPTNSPISTHQHHSHIQSLNGDSLVGQYIFPEIEEIAERKIDITKIFYENSFGVEPIKLEASLYELEYVELSDVIAKAIENNLNLLISHQDSLAAKWAFWKQATNFLPDLSLEAKKERLDGVFFIVQGLQTDIEQDRASAFVRFDYRAFDGGKRAFLTWAQRHFQRAADAREKNSYNETVRDAIILYNDLYKAQINLSNKLKALERTSTDLNLAKKFHEAGVGTKFAVYQAEASFAVAEQRLAEEQRNFRIAEILLAEHLNLALMSPLKVHEDDLRKFELVAEDLTMEEFLKIAFEKNPNIKTALENKKAAYKEAFAIFGDLLPKVDLFAEVAGFGEEFSDLNRLDTYGITTSFNFGRGMGTHLITNLMQAKAKAIKAKLEYQRERQVIEKNLRVAFLNLQRSRAIVRASRKELVAAKEALRLSRLRYRNGVGVFKDVVDKQDDLTQVEGRFIDSITDFNNSQVRLAYEMGYIDFSSLLQ